MLLLRDEQDGECGSNWTFDTPSAVDACSGAPVPATSFTTVTNRGPCPWVITRTWVFTDICGNTNTCSQTVTVVDTTPPVITCASNKTVQCGTAWTFDPPSAWDQCCGSNVTVWLASSNLISGPCPVVWQGIWEAMDCCSNVATCTQTVTVVDTTPPIFNTICVTNVFFAGGSNNFATPVATAPSVGLQTRLANADITSFKEFDDCSVNTFLAHTFANLPGGITSATLTMRLKPCGDIPQNDEVSLSFTGGDGNLLTTSGKWSSFLGADNGPAGLEPNDWTTANYPNGAVITLDLANLPGSVDLLSYINTYGLLDFICEDDTGVDYLQLTVVSCCSCCATNKTVPCGTAWTFDRPSAYDACCTNVTIQLISSNEIAGPCPAVWQGIWQAMDCCSNVATCTQTVTVVDITPPVIQCPSSIVVTSCVATQIFYTVTASNACCTNLTVWCNPPSGYSFAAGTATTVYCTVTNCCGLVASNTFTVTVVGRHPIAGLFNTGGTLGGTDAHYVLVVNPDGTNTQPNVVSNHVILSVWLTNTAASQWIGPQVDGLGVEYTNYDYRLTFTLCCTNDVSITGRWAADDGGAIYLNGSPIADPHGSLPTSWNSLTDWHNFTITSGFVPGQNILDFWVTNESSYTGLRVELSGTTACCSNTIQINCSNIITRSSTSVVLTNYPVTVTDNCCSNLNVWYVPAPPESFAPGTTNYVTCWASDCGGNTNYCPFSVVVLPVATNPTNIIWSSTSTQLTLHWPVDHTGWHLEMQTNTLHQGLNTNWQEVSGSTITNQMTLPITPANGCVFYRLRYP